VPPRIIIAVAGNVTHAQVVDLFGAGFNGFAQGARPRDAQPVALAPSVNIVHKALEQVHLVMGFPGLSHGAPERYAMFLLNDVIGGSMSSRLFQEVREQRGLAYAVDAFHWPFSDCGVFGISAGTAPEDAGELVEVSLACLRQASEDVTEEEVARARAQMKVGLLASLESPGGKLEQMARQVLVFGRAIPREELAARLDAVTLADVRAAGRSLLGHQPTIAAVGPLQGLPPAKRLRHAARAAD
jgi:predicted Zn-dependent peptidase